MAVPTKDSDLVSFSTNFSTRITATPTVFGLTAGDATAYAALHTAFLAAYNAVTTARDAGDRSKSLATAKDVAKDNLLVLARDLYGTVQADSTVSNANKNLLGVTVRSGPTPQPAPIVPRRWISCRSAVEP